MFELSFFVCTVRIFNLSPTPFFKMILSAQLFLSSVTLPDKSPLVAQTAAPAIVQATSVPAPAVVDSATTITIENSDQSESLAAQICVQSLAVFAGHPVCNLPCNLFWNFVALV